MENNLDGYAESRVVINKANSSTAAYNNKNIKIVNQGDTPNIYIQTSGYQNRNTSSIYTDIPRYMSFQKTELRGTGNVRSSLNVVKSEDKWKYIEIHRN